MVYAGEQAVELCISDIVYNFERSTTRGRAVHGGIDFTGEMGGSLRSAGDGRDMDYALFSRQLQSPRLGRL